MLFTSFANALNTRHKIIKNEHLLKRHFSKRSHLEKKAYWISSPLVDRCGVPIEDFVLYMRESLLKANICPGDLVYIPHPGRERDATVRYISAELGCDVDDRNLPVEFKVAYGNFVPSVIISPFSSALSSFASFLNERVRLCCAWHYEFDNIQSLSRYKEILLKSYQGRIEVIDICHAPSLFGVGPLSENSLPQYKSLTAVVSVKREAK